MNYLSLCSGIEAATVAWHKLGWVPVAFAEIEKFPSAVLAHHYPHVPNLGDMTRWREWPEDLLALVDVLVGGTPCTSFSIAGLRNSLNDERGNLTLVYAQILEHIDRIRAARGLPPVICVWENVPGVLTTKDNAFGCFLGALAGEDEALVPSGKKWTNAGLVRGPERAIAWRVLDAQYLGVAQRRRRVFLVGSARTGFRPEQVLFEFDGLRRDSAPSRETGKVAPTIPARSSAGGGLGIDFDCDGGLIPAWWDGGQVSQTLDAVLSKGQTMPEKNRFPAVLVPTVVHGTQDPCVDEHRAFALGRNNGGENVIAFDTTQITSAENRSNPQPGDPCHPLAAGAHAPAIAIQDARGMDKKQNGKGWNDDGSAYTVDTHATQAVAFQSSQSGVRVGDVHATLDSNNGSRRHNGTLQGTAVRRLTPCECERLQGFPDDYTAIPWRGKPAAECPDGPRYKALGNSMAVPCMLWIGRRIQLHLEVIAG